MSKLKVHINNLHSRLVRVKLDLKNTQRGIVQIVTDLDDAKEGLNFDGDVPSHIRIPRAKWDELCNLVGVEPVTWGAE